MRVLRVIGVGFAVSLASQAWAQDVELCLAIDASSSIDSTEWQLQLDGYANAIEDSNIVPQDGTVAIAAVRFATTASTVIQLTTIGSQTDADMLANSVSSLPQSGDGGRTGIGEGINECRNALAFNAPRVIIDISADGASNEGADANTAADEAINDGVDAINLIAIQQPASVLEDLARPQPASFNSGEDGFVIEVADFRDFEPAIADKIQGEITGGDSTPTAVPAMSRVGLAALIISLLLLSSWTLIRRN